MGINQMDFVILEEKSEKVLIHKVKDITVIKSILITPIMFHYVFLFSYPVFHWRAKSKSGTSH